MARVDVVTSTIDGHAGFRNPFEHLQEGERLRLGIKRSTYRLWMRVSELEIVAIVSL